MAGHRRQRRRGFRLRWLGAGVGSLLIAILVAAGACSWLTLPSYDGEERVAGLEAPVEIVRDAHAIPHVYARSPRDAAFAMGFVHAQDRLWQMELQRRIGAARLSEVFGERGLETDRFLRTLGVYRVAERNFAALSPEVQAIYEAYAAGVNAYLEGRSGLLPPEFVLLGHEPEPWRPADSLVWLKMMAWDLGDNFRDELLRARLAGRLDEAQLRDLWAPYPGDAPTAPEAGAPTAARSGIDVAGIDFEALAAALPEGPPAGLGSNNWALSGAHTESGKPLLANDPHLGLSIPSVWYLAHVHTGDFEIMGATQSWLPVHPGAGMCPWPDARIGTRPGATKPMFPKRSAKTMFCCGTDMSRSAATKPSQSLAPAARTSAPAVRSSASRAVQAKARTWSGSRKESLSSIRSETTGPWRVSRTGSVTGSPPETWMVSVRASKGRLPPGAR